MKNLIIVTDTLTDAVDIARYCIHVAYLKESRYGKHCQLDDDQINEIAEFCLHNSGDKKVYLATTKTLPNSKEYGEKFSFRIEGETVMCRLIDGEPSVKNCDAAVSMQYAATMR